ncbi:MAG: hypothetical protein V4598_01480 [Bdellovibrionota bacterium]
MKLVALIFLGLLGISCGGVILEKKEVVNLRAPAASPARENSEKLVFLKALESKYLQENKPLNLSITRAMMMEMNGASRGPASSISHAELKKLRKNQSFLSLELTIEHLSHREEVKLGTRHSAFHKRP